MTRKWMAPMVGLVLALFVGAAQPVFAFSKPAATAGKDAKAAAPAAGMQTVSGIIKGAPAGQVYTVVSGKKSTSVDAGGATIRQNGKFAPKTALAPGAYIRAQGSLSGSTLSAKTIEIVKAAGGSTKKKK